MRIGRIAALILVCSLPSWATWTHIQGSNAGATATTVSVVLPVNPVTGDLVVLSMQCTGAISAVTFVDSASNSYTQPAGVPFAGVSPKPIYVAYFLSAPANANKTIVASWTTSSFCQLYADQFHSTVTPVAYDKSSTGAGTASGGGAVATPSLTPTNASELLYSAMSTGGYGGGPSPTAGGTQGVWTGTTGGPLNGVFISEYDLSASVATAVDYVIAASTAYSGVTVAFSAGASTAAPTQAGAFVIQ